MKKFGSVLKSYFGHMGVYFMIVMIFFAMVSNLLKSSTVNLVLIWSAASFGALVALCDLLFMFPLIRSYVANVVIHGVLSIASFAFSFIWVSGVIERGRTGMFGVLFFSVFYVILAIIRCVYHFVTNRKANEKKEYVNLYTPTDVD